MKILVTGGAGFIGGNFAHLMVNKYPEDEIVVLDALTYAGNLETLAPVMDKPNFRFVKGDITDREFIDQLFEKEKFDIVVNFAAESHVDRSIEDPEVFLKAADFLSLSPSRCLVVEDAEAGVRAACAGGFDSAGLGDAAKSPLCTYPLTRFSDLARVCLG